MLGTNDLLRLGVFESVHPGYFRGLSWQNQEGEKTASVGLLAEHGADGVTSLRFSYSVAREGEEKESMDYRVQLVTRPCRFGGKRYWFICPLSKDGRACGRRVAKLYLPPGGRYFGCRQCDDLTYRSAQEHDGRVSALAKLPPDVLLRMSRSGGAKHRLLCLEAMMQQADMLER